MHDPQPEHARSAPPSLPEPKPVWPSVIGIIAIVFGAFGMLGGVAGLFAPLTNKIIAETMDPAQAAAFEAATKYQWWGVALSAASLMVAGLLLWGGILILKRKPSGARRLQHWAIAKIVLSFGMVGFQALLLPASFEAQQPAGSPGVPEGMVTVMVVSSVVFGLLWAMALPAFILVWFGRKKITTEVQSWGDEPGREGLEA